MNNTRALVLLLASACALPAFGAELTAPGDGFIAGSDVEVLLRNSYFNRSKEDGRRDARDWTQGVLGHFNSGFTQGTLGVGVEAFAYLGLKLDAPADKSGTGNLPVHHDGQPADNYSKVGAALKLRLSNSVLKVGEQRPQTPVFGVSHFRIVPQTATGLSLISREVEGLEVQAGHFTAATSPVTTHADGDLWAVMAGVTTPTADYLGGSYQLTPQVSVSLYGSRFEDIWNQYYVNLESRTDIDTLNQFGLGLSAYRTLDTGRARAGEIDNTSVGLSTFWRHGAHRWLLGLQKIDGDTPFDYLGVGDNDRNGRNGNDQGASIQLPNAAQFSDFNGPQEKSWQVRYDVSLATYGVPGLTFMSRYVRGWGIDGSRIAATGPYSGRYGDDGKHHETNLEVRYIVQSGPAKGMSVRARQAWHRANSDQGSGNLDDFRLITDYPIDIL